MYKHILLPSDGSDLARKGLEHGLALAKLHGAEVTLLTVSEPLHPESIRAAQLSGLDNAFTSYDQQRETFMRDSFAQDVAQAREQGVKVTLAHEIDSSPAEAIVRTARLNGCDLIVMSSHGRRGIQKMLLGSQTSEVLVKASVPVLVIR